MRTKKSTPQGVKNTKNIQKEGIYEGFNEIKIGDKFSLSDKNDIYAVVNDILFINKGKENQVKIIEYNTKGILLKKQSTPQISKSVLIEEGKESTLPQQNQGILIDKETYSLKNPRGKGKNQGLSLKSTPRHELWCTNFKHVKNSLDLENKGETTCQSILIPEKPYGKRSPKAKPGTKSLGCFTPDTNKLSFVYKELSDISVNGVFLVVSCDSEFQQLAEKYEISDNKIINSYEKQGSRLLKNNYLMKYLVDKKLVPNMSYFKDKDINNITLENGVLSFEVFNTFIISVQFQATIEENCYSWVFLSNNIRFSYNQYLIFILDRLREIEPKFQGYVPRKLKGKKEFEDLLNKSTNTINFVFHNASADIKVFSDFNSLIEKYSISNVQGGISMTMKNVDLLSQNKNYYYRNNITVYDTISLSVSGSKSLKSLGEVIGLEKGELTSYEKSNMIELCKNNPRRFLEYSLGDVYITSLYPLMIFKDDNKWFHTIGSKASDRFMEFYLKNYEFPKQPTGDDVYDKALQTDYNKLDINTKKSIFNYRYNGLISSYKIKDDGVLFQPFLTKRSQEIETMINYFSEAYFGGYNQCMQVGLFQTKTYDVDLKRAYPFVMSFIEHVDMNQSPEIKTDVNPNILLNFISNNLTIPVYAKVDINYDLLKDNYKLSEEIKKSIMKFPLVPVKESGSLVFPKKVQNANLTTFALYFALKLGIVENIKLAIIPSTKEFKIKGISGVGDWEKSLFKFYYYDLISERSYFEEKEKIEHTNKAMSKLTKTIANSTYGKTAQGMGSRKTEVFKKNGVFETEYITEDKISNSLYSSYTTDFTRVLLLITMINLDYLGFSSYSATTDGFITNANPVQVNNCILNKFSNLDMIGFEEQFLKMMGDVADYFNYATYNGNKKYRDEHNLETPDYLEDRTIYTPKHEQDILLNITSRGNVGFNEKGVLAKNGYKGLVGLDSDKERDIFIRLMLEYKDKDSEVKRIVDQQTRLTNLFGTIRNNNFGASNNIVNLSMEYDYKRKPIISTAFYNQVFYDNKTYNILTYDTEPYENIEDFKIHKNAVKYLFSDGCIRTIEDLEKVEELVKSVKKYQATYSIKNIKNIDKDGYKKLIIKSDHTPIKHIKKFLFSYFRGTYTDRHKTIYETLFTYINDKDLLEVLNKFLEKLYEKPLTVSTKLGKNFISDVRKGKYKLPSNIAIDEDSNIAFIDKNINTLKNILLKKLETNFDILDDWYNNVDLLGLEEKMSLNKMHEGYKKKYKYMKERLEYEKKFMIAVDNQNYEDLDYKVAKMRDNIKMIEAKKVGDLIDYYKLIIKVNRETLGRRIYYIKEN